MKFKKGDKVLIDGYLPVIIESVNEGDAFPYTVIYNGKSYRTKEERVSPLKS